MQLGTVMSTGYQLLSAIALATAQVMTHFTFKGRLTVTTLEPGHIIISGAFS